MASREELEQEARRILTLDKGKPGTFESIIAALQRAQYAGVREGIIAGERSMREKAARVIAKHAFPPAHRVYLEDAIRAIPIEGEP